MTDATRNDPLESYFDELYRYPYDGVPAGGSVEQSGAYGPLQGLLRHLVERLGLVR